MELQNYPAVQSWTRKVYIFTGNLIIATGTVHGGVDCFVNIDPDDGLFRHLIKDDVDHIKALRRLNTGLRFDKYGGKFVNTWEDYIPSPAMLELQIVCKTSFDVGIAGDRYASLTGDDSFAA
jgi:hypothetical protein